MRITIETIQEDEINDFYCVGSDCDCFTKLSGLDENTGIYDKGGCNTDNISDCPVFEKLLGKDDCDFCKHLETDEESDEIERTCGKCTNYYGDANGSMFELDFE